MSMKEIFKDKKECCGCGACMEICPVQAITMREDREGFLYPKINKNKCIDCGQCSLVCPMKRGNLGPGTKEQGKNAGKWIYIGAQAAEEALRYKSSSGGVFPVLARNVLKKGGAVFGSVMCEDGVVRHKMAQREEELAPMQKTKYVQSSLEGGFENVEDCLRKGRPVLFTGTPCQCRAMRLYLGRKKEKAGRGGESRERPLSENLLLVDLVCYGVPSPGIWRKYLKELEKKYGGKLSDFCFRDKREQDNGHTVSFSVGSKEYAHPMGEDSFCRVYFRNYTLRPACYFCKFCTTERESDITMGDFWGIEKVRPEMNDGMGTSLVILRSEKAKKIWEEVKENFRYFQCGREEILQPRLQEPVLWPGRRWRFMLLKQFLSVSLAERLLRK